MFAFANTMRESPVPTMNALESMLDRATCPSTTAPSRVQLFVDVMPDPMATELNTLMDCTFGS